MKSYYGHRRHTAGAYAKNGKPRKLTEKQAEEMRQAHAKGATVPELQKLFHVGRHTVNIALQADTTKLSDFILRPE